MTPDFLYFYTQVTKVKYLILILFSVAITSQVFSDMIMYVAFKSNQGYIASHLCINRNHPEKHCNGCCYMAKQIKKEKDAQQKGTNDFSKRSLSSVLYCTSLSDLLLPLTSSKFVSREYSYPVSNPALYGIFHPPRLSA